MALKVTESEGNYVDACSLQKSKTSPVPSEADFNQVKEHESDSVCSDVNSTDSDSRRNWSMVNL